MAFPTVTYLFSFRFKANIANGVAQWSMLLIATRPRGFIPNIINNLDHIRKLTTKYQIKSIS